MDTSTLRSVLERSGLTQYEADAYLTLVELGSATAVEVAEASDVPQARVYDVLRDLEADGYVETFQEGTLRAEATNPKEVVEEITNQAEQLVEGAKELEERWEKPNAENHTVSVVKRFQTVLDRAREAIDNAEHEVEVATTVAQYKQIRDALASAYDRGVVVKVTITTDPTSSPIEDVEELFHGVATEVRLRRLPTAFLVLVDRTEACFAPMERLPEGREYGVLVDDYTLSQIFDWYYQTAVWESWETIYSERDTDWPTTYTDMRDCLEDIAPRVRDGDEVIVTVEGNDRTVGEDISLVGRVTDVTYVGVDTSPSLASFVEEANITVETDDGTYVVGGWGALLEDVEANKIVVEAIDSAE